ncbi:MAG: glucuronate isomerase [Thermoguttaceae bacterium]
MKFIHENFLLQTKSAQRLYHDYAADLPIIDYHSHLPPKLIAEDYRFKNLAEIWLGGDHYKWRAMRAAGIQERCITGTATDWEKFQAFASVVPQTLRNPIYHWTHLELKRPFGIDDLLLSPETAEQIWNRANEKLGLPDFSTRGILLQMKVQLLCTTDDPADSLDFHKKITADNTNVIDTKCSANSVNPASDVFSVRVLPTFRPDRVMNLGSPAARTVDAQKLHEIQTTYIKQLEKSCDTSISNFADLISVLRNRHDFFHANGCRLSDHGFGLFDFNDNFSDSELGSIFDKILCGKEVSHTELVVFRSAIMLEVGKMNAEKNWTMQLHLGALRNNRTVLFETLGPDCGCDSIGDGSSAAPLSRFLDVLDRQGRLPKTIIYNLNPADNEMIATMIGNFQDGQIPGKLQYGSGWWFLDQKDGMEKQLCTLSNQGLLSRFVGMLTDSRSFLSFTRHEYFRRILCNLLGDEIENGLIPSDFELVGRMVTDICHDNAERYFGFP